MTRGQAMTLIYNSFILSFQTLWRYLLIMPFVVIPGLLVVVSLLVVPFLATGGAMLSILLFAPLLFGGLLMLIATFLITAFMTFNIMMGCRSAFSAMGRQNELDFGRLVGKSLTFTLVQMIVGVFLMVVLGGVVAIAGLTSAGGLSLQSFQAAPEAAMLQLAENPVILVVSILSVLLSLAVSALLAVPMAGTAISATPKMGPTDPFLGLGTAFLPVLIVLIITQVLCTLTGAYAQLAILFGQGMTALFQLNAGRPVALLLPPEMLALAAAMTLLVIWASCWFYSAAALGWQKFKDDRDEALAIKTEVNRFSPDELRRLREQREQTRGVVGH
jgi:hypothetical protein